LASAVLANYAGASRRGPFGSNGLAIYFPDSGHQYREDQYAQGGYERTNTLYPVEFVQKEAWADLLHAYLAGVP
jgi:hypothetical protein